ARSSLATSLALQEVALYIAPALLLRPPASVARKHDPAQGSTPLFRQDQGSQIHLAIASPPMTGSGCFTPPTPIPVVLHNPILVAIAAGCTAQAGRHICIDILPMRRRA